MLTLQPLPAAASLGTQPLAPGLLGQFFAAANRVDGLTVEELDDGTTILRLRGTAKPTFNVYRLDDPDRLVVDIAKSARGSVVPHVPLDTWACGRVTVEGVSERDAKLVRVVVQLKREASYIVVPDGEELVVTVTPREVPPEQYFARQSAAKRKAEIENRQARAKRLERDASALKAEARALNAEAGQKARKAEARAAAAEKRVRDAESVAKRARHTEARARAAEAQAEKALGEAKSNRLAVRRALKRAKAERERAQTDRQAAESKLARAESAAIAKRKESERLLAAAEAVARKRLADAASKNAKADAVLGAAEVEAKRRIADAETSRKAARAELAAAKKAAASADAAADRKLAAAQAKATAAQAKATAARRDAAKARTAAASADAAAKKTLARAEKTAQAQLVAAQSELREAKAAARKSDDRAKARLAQAERAMTKATAAEAAAQRTLAEATARAQATEAEANRTLARAQQTQAAAQATQAAAQATQAAAKRSHAEAQRNEAEAKRSQVAAKRSQAAAERTEAAAEKRAAAILASANKKAADELRAARSKAKAEAARELEQAKKRAATVVASAKNEAAALKKKRLAEAEATAAATIARAERDARTAAKKRASKAEAEAELKLAKAKKRARKDSITAAEKELARVRAARDAEVAAAVKIARTKAKSKADSKLSRARAEIEAEAARQVKQARASASKAESAARSKLEEADVKLATARKEQASASAKLAQARADRASAEKMRASAEKTLASAEAARKQAESEKSKAEGARKEAERALAEVRREAAASGKRGRARRQADQRLAAAEKERDAAVSRQLAAAKKLSSLEGEASKARASRDAARAEQKQAEAQLASLQKERDSLRAELDQRDARLAAMQREMDSANKARNAKPRSKRAKKKPKTTVAKLRDVRFESDSGEQRVIVEFEGPVRYDGMSLTPTIQLLKFSDAKLGKKLERSLDASGGDGSVKVITSFSEGKDAKVIVSTKGPVKPRIEEKAGELVWHFPHSAAAQPPATTKVAAQGRREHPPKAVSMDGAKVGGFAAVPKPRGAMAPAGIGRAQADVTRGRRTSRGRWRGERIDIELQDAPIKDVLLLFSDIGRVNIVAGDGVDGSVTMKLNSVPWDQALDIILRSLSLGSIREGNVIRVATLTALEEERRQAIERANARVQLKPLETRLVPLSYATVDEMVAKVQTVLSPRGTVTPDTRTNTLIVMDVSENIALAQDLVKSLDTQTPQVLIEARIVEARTTFTRQLGIQWGFDFTASPGTGNPTGLLFPNSIGVGGGGTGTPVDSRGLVLPGAAANPNYAVDLPAPVGTGAGGAIGMSFGSISGNLNTNLRLSAAETTGEVRIISAPKIVTLDNSEANIEQGVQIPISQVSAQGVNTRFVNATLSLQVTPHVTNEGAVLLDVTVQKNEADFVNTGARGDPTILTRQAQSRMLVNDADTAVIGGIYTRNKAVNYTKIPWLADVPIVGWFFKSKAEADTRSEVLIFLTPKIVNRASSIGG